MFRAVPASVSADGHCICGILDPPATLECMPPALPASTLRLRTGGNLDQRVAAFAAVDRGIPLPADCIGSREDDGSFVSAPCRVRSALVPAQRTVDQAALVKPEVLIGAVPPARVPPVARIVGQKQRETVVDPARLKQALKSHEVSEKCEATGVLGAVVSEFVDLAADRGPEIGCLVFELDPGASPTSPHPGVEMDAADCPSQGLSSRMSDAG